jgi:hypothetical protein
MLARMALWLARLWQAVQRRGSRAAPYAQSFAMRARQFLKQLTSLVLSGVAATVRTVWRAIRAPLLTAIQVVAALLLLFEEWGWQPLVALLGLLARYRIFQRAELAIAGLPPYGALAALALPTAILFPLKFVALFLLAKGQAIAAGALFVGSKIASTALIARLFLLTKPALMRIRWFQRAYDWLIPWQTAMFAAIRASWVWRYGRILKSRIAREAHWLWTRMRPVIVEARARFHAYAKSVFTTLRPLLRSEFHRLRRDARQLWARVSNK